MGSLAQLHVSIIIPALSDAGRIEQTVASAQGLGAVQVLVVDAGSTDDTALIAMRAGAKVLRVREPGGRQLRHAVTASTGDVLLFVRPGTTLASDALGAIREALDDPKVLGGVLRCSLAGRGLRNFLLRAVYAALAPFGIMAFGAPWFVWRTAVESEEGFRSLRVFEERDLLARLRRRGTVKHLNSVALLDDNHELHRLIWTLLQVPYDMGVSWRLLSRLYRKPKSLPREQTMTALQAIERELIRPADAALQ